MKGQQQFDRTKVVLRHLPPTISKAALLERIDSVFAGRYSWLSFRPGKNREKHSFSRAYLDFKRPEDVVEFAELFGGHVFVNEKGIQFKTTVEYAPSQRIPKQWSKKDGREGTINMDSEYLEFLEFLAKPAENLPSAEKQLERREAERAVLGAMKDTPIVTPLMDSVRQKRAAKGGSWRSLSNGKLTRQGVGSSAEGLNSGLSKRGTDRRRNTTKMYVLRDAIKNTTVRGKSKYIGVAKRDTFSSTAGAEVLEESGKKRVLLLTAKERETSHVSINIPQHQNTSSTKIIVGLSSLKQIEQCKRSGGRISKSILQNKNVCQYHSSAVHSDMQIQAPKMEKDKRHSRPQHGQVILKDTNGAMDYKGVGSDMHGFCSEKKEKRTRNKDRLDRGVWAPRHHSDGSLAKDESPLSVASQPARLLDSLEGYHKHLGRCGSMNNVKEGDGSFIASEGKHSKSGGASSCGSHEKQVWVRKSSSGS